MPEPIEILGELTIDRAAGSITPPVPGDSPRTITTLNALRETVRTDDLGRYRPLSGARTLPSGWRFQASPAASLDEAVDVIYPLALVHIAQQAAGQLRIVTLDDVFARQQGRYRVAAELSPAGRTLATTALCSLCIRNPIWQSDPNLSPLSSRSGRGGQGVRVPCPEPCSVLLSLCREAATWGKDPPTPSSPSNEVPFAAFETPGNPLREHYLSALIPDP